MKPVFKNTQEMINAIEELKHEMGYIEEDKQSSSQGSKFDSRAAKEQLEKLEIQRQIHNAKQCKSFITQTNKFLFI